MAETQAQGTEMTTATYDAAMFRVFADEGGYSNDPVDPGGATNFGITIIDACYVADYEMERLTPSDYHGLSIN
jgi:lysozyme family protein